MAVSERVSVFGVYQNFRALRTSLDVLKSFGFRNEDICVLFPEGAVAALHCDESQSGKATDQVGDFVQRIEPMIEPLIGGAVGCLTYVDAFSRGVLPQVVAGFGIPGFATDIYEKFLQCGEPLLAVRTLAPAGADRAEGILQRTGAHHILRACSVVPTPKNLLRTDIPIRPAAPGRLIR